MRPWLQYADFVRTGALGARKVGTCTRCAGKGAESANVRRNFIPRQA